MPISVATVRDPQSAEYLKSLALGDEGSGRLSLWREAFALDPDSSTLATHLGHALLDAKQHDAAVEVLAPAFERWPRHTHLVNLLAVALFERGQTRAAEGLFRHLLELDPEYPSAKGSLESALHLRARSKPAPAGHDARIARAVKVARARPRPTLAACMIVKDEAEFVVGAIESVRGLADEVVVVDTGSTDNTVSLARAAGARVEHFPWNGSFADARNASLEHATADWLLVLDADERVTQASRSVIRGIMEEDEPSLRVYCPKIKNYTRAGRYLNDGFSGRLFRNHPEMRFEGRVHEEVGRGRPEVSTDYRLDVVFDHFGADPDVMREKAKDARNLELLEARLAEAPDDLLTWFYLGSQHWLGGRRQDARDAFRRVADLFERNPSAYGTAVSNIPVPYSYVGLVRTQLDLGDARGALAAARRGLARYPDNPDLWYHGAFAQLAAGDRAGARDAAVRASRAKIGGYALISMHDKSITSWKAAKLVADLDFEAEERRAAYDGYAGLVEAMPEGLEKVVVAARLVELASQLGELDALRAHTLAYVAMKPEAWDVAMQVAQALGGARGLQAAYDLLTQLYDEVEAVRDQVEIPLAIGSIAEQADEPQEALRWYEVVVSMNHRDPRFWANLGQLLVRLGAHDEAAEVLKVAQQLAREQG